MDELRKEIAALREDFYAEVSSLRAEIAAVEVKKDGENKFDFKVKSH